MYMYICIYIYMYTSLDLVNTLVVERFMGVSLLLICCSLNERFWGCLKSPATIALLKLRKHARI